MAAETRGNVITIDSFPRAPWRTKLGIAVTTGYCPECGAPLVRSFAIAGARLRCGACDYETLTTATF
jgi:ribosomal protein S27AE